MSKSRLERARENFALQGGRPQRRTLPEEVAELATPGGPGKRAEERIVSLPVDEILPDRYQGRLRWPVELPLVERLYSGEWDAQDFLDEVARQRRQGSNPALEDAWQGVVELARSILSEGQVAPITVAPARGLPVGYRFVIETGEGRFWAYQMMRWLQRHDPTTLDVAVEDWHEDPTFIRAVAIPEPSRLRQVAENEQRQSYASAVDRAIAYASMLAEEGGWEVTGAPPGIRGGLLELPDAYWRAARRGLRGRKAVLQQVPSGERQIQRHLKLLTDVDPQVLALAKQHNLSEAQLRPLVGQPVEEQRRLGALIVAEGLSSREVEALQREEEIEEPAAPAPAERRELTTAEEVSRLLRTLTRAASRYDALRSALSDHQLLELIEIELRSYDESSRGRRRSQSPRRRLLRLRALLDRIEPER